MCGRYFFELRDTAAFAKLKQKLQQQSLFEYAQEEVFPGNQALVFIGKDDDYRLDVMKWGIAGPYGKLINARSEGIETKKTFRPMLSQKCLIPCNGFFEWMKVGKQKQKIYIRRQDAELFYLAGIYNEHKEFVIMTKESCGDMKRIHDRCPLIMLEDQIPLYFQDQLDVYVDDLCFVFEAADQQKPSKSKADVKQMSLFDGEQQ